MYTVQREIERLLSYVIYSCTQYRDREIVILCYLFMYTVQRDREIVILSYLFMYTVQREIEERRDFLEEMKRLGRSNDYQKIIETEISQVTVHVSKKHFDY